MEFRIMSLPPFKAATSKVDVEFNFEQGGILGEFNNYFSAIKPLPRDSFLPRDFLYFDEQEKGLVWIYAINDDIDCKDNEVVDFDGGFYITYAYMDGDEEANAKLYQEALDYINHSELFELDIRPNHYPLGHIITPPEIVEKTGFAQMVAYVPIKLR